MTRYSQNRILRCVLYRSLNQVLVAWSIERHVEKSQGGLFKQPFRIGQCCNSPQSMSISHRDRGQGVDKECVGLPGLLSILNSSYHLPHPAIQRLKLDGTMQAPSLAKLTLDLLQQCILPPLLNEKVQWRALFDLPQLSIIRTSNTLEPRQVNLACESPRNGSQVVAVHKVDGQVIQDAQIDCPEYICFYCFRQYPRRAGEPDVMIDPQNNAHPHLSSFMFREVMVDEGMDDRRACAFSEILTALKTSAPSLFQRSLVFILCVGRESRSLFTYNWEPSKLEK